MPEKIPKEWAIKGRGFGRKSINFAIAINHSLFLKKRTVVFKKPFWRGKIGEGVRRIF